jgi:hypothetical protein
VVHFDSTCVVHFDRPLTTRFGSQIHPPSGGAKGEGSLDPRPCGEGVIRIEGALLSADETRKASVIGATIQLESRQRASWSPMIISWHPDKECRNLPRLGRGASDRRHQEGGADMDVKLLGFQQQYVDRIGKNMKELSVMRVVTCRSSIKMNAFFLPWTGKA